MARLSIRRSRPVTLIALALWCTLIAATLLAMQIFGRRHALKELRASANHTLQLVTETIKGDLARFRSLPQLLASNPLLIDALTSGRADQIDRANNELQRINRVSGALDTYLMNSTGKTIAASNWMSEKTFVGLDFSYRPYFREAMAGRLGRFLALGTTSDERGYYFAFPVMSESRPAGAIVVKMSVADIESNLRLLGQEIVVTDENNVVFLTTNAAWTYHALTPLTDVQLSEIRSNKKYSYVTVDEMPIRKRTYDAYLGETMLIAAATNPISASNEYLVLTASLPEPEWRVLLLARTDLVTGQVRYLTLLAGGCVFGVGAAVAFLWQRRFRREEQLAIHRRARAELEQRVEARTSELQLANERLRAEVADRTKAEEDLVRTQANLIQAAKLAVLGRISAGISHELNQPLAAMRSYADNAQTYLQRGQPETALSNLVEISELTERMATIIKHLRTYARDEVVEARPTSVATALKGAFTLLETRIKAEQVAVETHSADTKIMVMAGDVRLQQVFVNVIANALDAMTSASVRRLQVSVTNDAQNVRVIFRDSGTGIASDIIQDIFDPFYSTRPVGAGLGLGLSISEGIIRQFRGTITAGNPPGGGAEFIITLPSAMEGAYGR